VILEDPLETQTLTREPAVATTSRVVATQSRLQPGTEPRTHNFITVSKVKQQVSLEMESLVLASSKISWYSQHCNEIILSETSRVQSVPRPTGRK
jgi:hypothetical protein